MANNETRSSKGDHQHSDGLDKAIHYPLFDALLNRRSRRFGLGASLPGGARADKRAHAPSPLSKKEEALLAFAAAGITGFVLADLPFQEGELHEGGGGNVMATLIGRTGAPAPMRFIEARFS